MSWKASDGRAFPTFIQRNKYEQWLHDKGAAPGGPSHEEAYRLHGVAKHIEVDIEDGGRYVVRTKHADGYQYQGVHPQAHVANDVVGHLIGVNPPIAIETHGRARAHPTGPKEEERIAREDSRVVDFPGTDTAI
jgi:hypothetical protein